MLITDNIQQQKNLPVKLYQIIHHASFADYLAKKQP